MENTTPLPTTFVEALIKRLGKERVFTDAGDVWSYGYDNSRRHVPPQAVVLPKNHEEVRDIIRLCNEHHVYVLARGHGTATTGSTVPVRGGVVISMEKMNRIIEVDAANRLMRVEPGVTNQAVQDAAKAEGFFWAPDPTSAPVSTIGGNLATNAAGPRGVKYGTPRENVLGLRCVTGAGDELVTGVKTTKGVVGYDLTRLIVGSEGDLAVITEATLKLTPLPETKRTLRAIYADIGSAARAVSRIMAQPITPCALEFIDGQAINMIRGYTETDLPENAGALLMIEVDGSKSCIDGLCESVMAAARGEGCLKLTAARTEEEVKALWQTRKALSPALRKVAPKKINEDVVVPVSHIPELIESLDQLSKKHGIIIITFGHAGNGNIHVNLLVDPSDADAMQRAHACLAEVFDKVLELGGTLSGEHGIGIDKREFVAQELSPVAIQLMRNIKAQFDPLGLLNPDKGLPVINSK